VQRLSIASLPGEPLAPWFSAPGAADGVSLQRFECTSRGDRIGGRIWCPERAQPRAPLLLAIHALGGSAADSALDAAARAWARAELVTIAIDLPLHGERHNAKLSRRALAGSGGGPDAALWGALLAQAVGDLARALDVAALRAGEPIRGALSVAFGNASAIALAHAQLDARVARVVALGPTPPRDAAPPASATKPIHRLERPDDLVAWLRAAPPA
jgi:predicted esterase